MKKIIFMALALGLIIIGLPLIIISTFDSEEIVEEPSVQSQYKVKVLRKNSNQVSEMDLEEYIKGVVASEMPGEFETEALRAQAIAARTYAMSRMAMFSDAGHPDHSSAPLCDGVHCQVYRSMEEIKNIKSSDWMAKYWSKISDAVESTRGMVMIYDNELVNQPLFHSTSGGKTENSEDVFTTAVPYLRSVESPYEAEAPHFRDSVTIDLKTFKSKIASKYSNLIIDLSSFSNNIEIEERSDGGRVSKIKVGNLILSGRDVRETLGLRSANFTFKTDGSTVTFNTVGYGHGVGMSQWGANGMAKEGHSYENILKHFYQGVEIENLDEI